MFNRSRTRRYDQTEQIIVGAFKAWGSDPLTFEAFAAGSAGGAVSEDVLSRAFARLVQDGILVHTDGGYILSPEASHRSESA